MGTKPKTRKRVPLSALAEEAVTDVEIDRFLTSQHRAIEAKLAEARRSIERGDVSSLEPLPKLLRAVRRNAKPPR
jgi:hypothetical protein